MNYSREKALGSLKDRIKDAKTLVICDPYILTISKKEDPHEYVRELGAILPEGLNKIAFVHSQSEDNPLFNDILFPVFSTSFHVKAFKCDKIHDRVWIVNNKSAFATGTSFNSIGYRLSFINDLDPSDFKEFWHFLAKELGDDFKNFIF